METRFVKIPSGAPLGHFEASGEASSRLEKWVVDIKDKTVHDALEESAAYLKEKDIPAAFPTETVYGLGADATRSAAVKGIYAAKGRPSDNPLIIHVPDLQMLRGLLGSQPQPGEEDVIPKRYLPLINKFWPGPLTILMPNPEPSKLAPEVTAGLPTFGVRMPSSTLALSLIKLAGVPLAAPSANASTKPSPTTAHHVMHDLNGRIELILDGGPCEVGVESTVVDGLCDPPVVLRPGGIGINEIRTCPGWENTVKAYKDASEEGKSTPRAPGMKYKHYSPKAKVVLYEQSYLQGTQGLTQGDVEAVTGLLTEADSVAPRQTVGVIRTKRWAPGAGLRCSALTKITPDEDSSIIQDSTSYEVFKGTLQDSNDQVIGEILDIDLGKETRGIAQGLFSALRELDLRGADIIFVDGIDDDIDIAAAVMNRLRKAASDIRS